MKILGCTSALLNPSPPTARPTTASVILDAIAEALNRDGCSIEPGDIDSAGLWLITCDGYRYRVELTTEDDAELVDDADWRRRFDSADANGGFGHDDSAPRLDPAGVNGMTDPDDIAF